MAGVRLAGKQQLMEESRRSQGGKTVGKALETGQASSRSSSTILQAGLSQRGHSGHRKSPNFLTEGPCPQAQACQAAEHASPGEQIQAASTQRQTASK